VTQPRSFANAQDPDTRSEFSKGVSAGVDTLQGSLYGLAALVGDSVGNERLKQWGLENYQRNQEEAASAGLSVPGLKDIEDVGDFFSFASGALGQAVPSLLSSVVGGGVGGVVGRAVTKKAVERLAAQGVKKELAEQAVKKALASPEARKKIMSGIKIGSLSGAFAASAGQQQGLLYGDLREAGVDDAALPAWAFGAGMGALDIVGEVALAKRLLPNQAKKELQRSLLRGLAQGTGRQAAIEGATEGAQAALGSIARILNKEGDEWTQEDWDELATNVAAGAIVGAVLGAPVSLIEEARKRPAKKQEQRAAQKPAQESAAPSQSVEPEVQPQAEPSVSEPAAAAGAQAPEVVEPPVSESAAQAPREITPPTQQPVEPAATAAPQSAPTPGRSARDEAFMRRMVLNENYAPIKTPQSALKFARYAREDLERLSNTPEDQLSEEDAQYLARLRQLFYPTTDAAMFMTETDGFTELPAADQARLLDEFERAWRGRSPTSDDLSIPGSAQQRQLVDQMRAVLPAWAVDRTVAWMAEQDMFRTIGESRDRFPLRALAARAMERAYGIPDTPEDQLTPEQLEVRAEAARLRREQRGIDEEFRRAGGGSEGVDIVTEEAFEEGPNEDDTGDDDPENTSYNPGFSRTDASAPFTFIGRGGRRHGEKGLGTARVVAYPITDTDNETAAARAQRMAAEQQRIDPDAVYAAVQVSEADARAAELGGPGWYVAAYRVPSAERVYSPVLGEGGATIQQAVQTYVRRAKTRYQQLSINQKEPRPKMPVWGFKLAVLDAEGKPVKTAKGNNLEQGFAAHDITELGHTLLDTHGDTSGKATLDAFRAGLAAIATYVEPNGRRYQVTDEPLRMYALVIRDHNPHTGTGGMLLGRAIRAADRQTSTTDVEPMEGETFEEARDRTIARGGQVSTIGRGRPISPRGERTDVSRERPVRNRQGVPVATRVEVREPEPGSQALPANESVPVAERGAPDLDTRAFESAEEANLRSIGRSTEYGISRAGRARTMYNEPAPVRALMSHPLLSERLGGMAQEIRNILKLRFNIVISDDPTQFLHALRMAGYDHAADVAAAKIATDLRAAFVLTAGTGNTRFIFLNPEVSDGQMVKSLAHEMGHVFFQQYWGDTDIETRKQLIDAFERFIELNSDFRPNLKYEERFEEWMADQVAAWVATDKTPRTAIERWFKGVADYLRQVWQWIRNQFPLDQTAAEFIRETIRNVDYKLDPTLESFGAANSMFHDDEISLREPSKQLRNLWAKARAFRARHPRLDSILDAVTETAMALHNGLTASLQARLRRMNIPAINELISHFHHRPGEEGGWTYDMAVANRMQNFKNEYESIVSALDAKERRELMEELREEKSLEQIKPKYRPYAEAMRQFFRRLYDYQRDAHLPIEYVENYFPQVGDAAELMKPDAIDTIFEALSLAGVTATGRNGEEVPITRRHVEEFVENMRDETYTLNYTHELEGRARVPFERALRSRRLPPEWREALRDIKDDKGQARFYAKSLDEVMYRYIREATRRSEYNRRFGDVSWDDPEYIRELEREHTMSGSDEPFTPPEFDPHKQLSALIERAKREGATDDQIILVYDAMSAFMGNYGRVKSEPVRRLMKSVAFYQNLRTLLMVTLSSLPEFTTLFLRTGNFGDTWRVIRQSAADAWKKGGNAANTLRALGFAVDELDALNFKEFYDARDYSSKINRLNESWFRAIGLTRWTNFMRGLSLNVSIDYMKQHAQRVADGLDETGDSQRRLDELGVSVDDLRAWAAAGEPIYGRAGYTFEDLHNGSAVLDEATLQAVHRVSGALTRMINEIVVNPTAAMKPLWRSSERLMLVSQLGSFMYGFFNQVLTRVWHELNRTGAPTMARAVPLISLMLMVPIVALGLEIKELFQYVIWGKEPRTDGMSGPEYLRELISRTGILGPAQLALDAHESASYGRDPLGVLVGPTLSQVQAAWRDISQAENTSRTVVKHMVGSIPFISSMPGARDALVPAAQR
jgi:hypothetical protein